MECFFNLGHKTSDRLVVTVITICHYILLYKQISDWLALNSPILGILITNVMSLLFTNKIKQPLGLLCEVGMWII